MELKSKSWDDEIIISLTDKDSMIIRCALCHYLDTDEFSEDGFENEEVSLIFRTLRELNLDRNRKRGLLPK